MVVTKARFVVVLEEHTYPEGIVDGAELDAMFHFARLFDLQPVLVVLLQALLLEAAASV